MGISVLSARDIFGGIARVLSHCRANPGLPKGRPNPVNILPLPLAGHSFSAPRISNRAQKITVRFEDLGRLGSLYIGLFEINGELFASNWRPPVWCRDIYGAREQHDTAFLAKLDVDVSNWDLVDEIKP